MLMPLNFKECVRINDENEVDRAVQASHMQGKYDHVVIDYTNDKVAN